MATNKMHVFAIMPSLENSDPDLAESIKRLFQHDIEEIQVIDPPVGEDHLFDVSNEIAMAFDCTDQTKGIKDTIIEWGRFIKQKQVTNMVVPTIVLIFVIVGDNDEVLQVSSFWDSSPTRYDISTTPSKDTVEKETIVLTIGGVAHTGAQMTMFGKVLLLMRQNDGDETVTRFYTEKDVQQERDKIAIQCGEFAQKYGTDAWIVNSLKNITGTEPVATSAKTVKEPTGYYLMLDETDDEIPTLPPNDK